MNEFDRKLSIMDDNSLIIDKSVDLNKIASVRRSTS